MTFSHILYSKGFSLPFSFFLSNCKVLPYCLCAIFHVFPRFQPFFAVCFLYRFVFLILNHSMNSWKISTVWFYRLGCTEHWWIKWTKFHFQQKSLLKFLINVCESLSPQARWICYLYFMILFLRGDKLKCKLSAIKIVGSPAVVRIASLFAIDSNISALYSMCQIGLTFCDCGDHSICLWQPFHACKTIHWALVPCGYV